MYIWIIYVLHLVDCFGIVFRLFSKCMLDCLFFAFSKIFVDYLGIVFRLFCYCI
jgi:hypothetical protein